LTILPKIYVGVITVKNKISTAFTVDVVTVPVLPKGHRKLLPKVTLLFLVALCVNITQPVCPGLGLIKFANVLVAPTLDVNRQVKFIPVLKSIVMLAESAIGTGVAAAHATDGVIKLLPPAADIYPNLVAELP
jgi:hypothetical protein